MSSAKTTKRSRTFSYEGVCEREMGGTDDEEDDEEMEGFGGHETTQGSSQSGDRSPLALARIIRFLTRESGCGSNAQGECMRRLVVLEVGHRLVDGELLGLFRVLSGHGKREGGMRIMSSSKDWIWPADGWYRIDRRLAGKKGGRKGEGGS